MLLAEGTEASRAHTLFQKVSRASMAKRIQGIRSNPRRRTTLMWAHCVALRCSNFSWVSKSLEQLVE